MSKTVLTDFCRNYVRNLKDTPNVKFGDTTTFKLMFMNAKGEWKDVAYEVVKKEDLKENI